MEQEEKEEIIEEIEHLIYEKPKCDFEYIWNCALNSVFEIFNDEE